MGRLIYTAIASLDGYIADADGSFDWSAPDEEVHAFVNDQERGTGTFLCGRRLYEVMAVWDTIDDPAPVMRDFAAIWRAATKIVYSRTLRDVARPRTRIERDFDPAAVRRLADGAAADVSVGGAELAAQALRARIVDECRLYLSPVVVGGGTPALPSGLRLGLELLDERRFANGVVYLRYRCSSGHQ